MSKFKNLIVLFLLVAFAPALLWAGGQSYNYYENGLEYMKKAQWDRAIDEFRSAVSLEFTDRPNFKTYGMHFIDYFPHREMAICYYNLGDMDKAKKEMELSMAFKSTGRSKDYWAKISNGEAPPATMASRADDENLTRERARLDAEKKRIAEEQAALDARKRDMSAEASRKAAQEEMKLAAQRDRIDLAERQHQAVALDQGKLPVGALTYDPSRVTQVGSRLSIAVLPFDNRSGNAEITNTVQDKMITSLYSLKRFKIIERSQIDKVMSEQKLGMTGAIDPAKAVKAGKILGVDAILMGSISSTATGIGMDARLIDTESSGVITAKDAYSGQNTLQDIKTMATDIAIQIYNDIPLVEGYLIKVNPTGEVFLDIGTAKGMRKGMKVVVYKEGEEIKHPVTGEILGKQVTKVGELLLTEVQEKMAEAHILEKEAGQTLTVGQKVVAK
ncbi:MAG: CsgG/HfaB family protein [bacterium]|nr:CsgG/HfaB family protein [bacterium]